MRILIVDPDPDNANKVSELFSAQTCITDTISDSLASPENIRELAQLLTPYALAIISEDLEESFKNAAHPHKPPVIVINTQINLQKTFAQVAAAHGHTENHVLTAGPFSINMMAQECTVNGKEISLGPKQYALMRILALHAPNVLSIDTIMGNLYHPDTEPGLDIIKVMVSKIRKKIREAGSPEIIRAVHKEGWLLVDPESQQIPLGEYGPIKLFPDNSVTNYEQRVQLTCSEGTLLKLLLEKPGRTVSNDMIKTLRERAHGGEVDEKTPKVLISRLRHKLAQASIKPDAPYGERVIHTKWGAGLCLGPPIALPAPRKNAETRAPATAP